MEPLLPTISHISQNVATGVTILSVVIAVLKEKYSNIEFVPDTTKYPLGHKEVFRSLKWIMWICAIIYIVATCILLCIDDIPNTYIISTLITFLVLLVAFVYASIQGKKSLDSRAVMAPKELWQMMFNRIPSYLEECDGPFRIYILKIGMGDEHLLESDTDRSLAGTINRQTDETIEAINAYPYGNDEISTLAGNTADMIKQL